MGMFNLFGRERTASEIEEHNREQDAMSGMGSGEYQPSPPRKTCDVCGENWACNYKLHALDARITARIAKLEAEVRELRRGKEDR